MSEQRLEIVDRLRQLEAFLCSGRKTKRECCNALGYAYERAFSRDLTDLETLGSGVIRVVDPGKKSQYYCPRAKAIFRHTNEALRAASAVRSLVLQSLSCEPRNDSR